MIDRTRVGLLTTRRHPLLGEFLTRLAGVPELEPVLLFDAKDFSDKDRRIFAERTADAFPPFDLDVLIAGRAYVDVLDHNDAACVEWVRTQRLPLLVNAGTPRIVKTALLEAPALGVLNAHPGLLPKYRGASCCEWAIHHDEPVGVTAHFMDAGLDSGPIILSRALEVRRGMTYVDVRVALYRLAHEVRIEAMRRVVAERLRPGDLPRQPDAPAFKPIPDELLALVKQKLARGEYAHAR
jgi:folate-dependent phosphoribosylglycinamide formyltransferase PurN